ncbi:MAG: site-specific DNA-methyltransferase [Verrucomicrobiales bacterium]|nr:site-specific DNA-methyltransferase [Verrucomicrobiales bacterium]
MSGSDHLPGFEDGPDHPGTKRRAPAAPKVTGSFTTRFELRHGDCVEGMKSLPDESIDLVVTSPPYNLGIGYEQYRDRLSPEDYLAWSLEWAGEVRRLLKPGGSFFLNVGAAPANPWMPHELALALRPLFILQNTIHWIKSITVEPRQGDPVSVGHFKPINSKRYLTDCHEYLFHFTKSGNVPLDRLAVGVPYADKSNIARWGHTDGRDKRCRGNNWFVPYETIMSRDKERPHPATFPVDLAKKCIALHGGDPATLAMLEPFLGIGNAAVAAGERDVARFIGFEIDETYLAEARRRVGLET